MRVVFPISYPKLGGKQLYVLDVAGEFLRRGIEARILLGTGGPMGDEAARRGIAVERGRLLSVPRSFRGSFGYPGMLLRLIIGAVLAPVCVIGLAMRFRRNRTDVVYCNGLRTVLTAGLAGRLAGARVVYHLHSAPGEMDASRRYTGGTGARLAVGISHHIVPLSEDARSRLEEVFPAAMMTVVYNGLDLAGLERILAEETPGPWARPEGRLVGTVARVSPEKGIDHLIRALGEIKGGIDTTRLVVFGEESEATEGVYTRELLSIAEEAGVADFVRFEGFRRDVVRCVRELDVFVLASLDEPFGRVLLEAMYCGVPVIGTGAGGIPEIITHGETGLLVPPGDSAALAGAIRRMLEDPADAERMAAAARERVLELFTLEKTVDRVVEMLGPQAAGASAEEGA